MKSALELLLAGWKLKYQSLMQLSLQGWKCPGPDGYASAFFAKFWEKLAPVLLDVYNEALAFGALPQTVNQAIISLLLKKERSSLCYKPFGCKLLSKLLSLLCPLL